MKTRIALLMVIFLVALSFSVFGFEATYRLGHVVDETHPYNLGSLRFAELIEEYTDGKIKIEVFPAGQLAPGERELIEGLQIGTVDFTVTASAPVSGFSESVMALDLPFMFRNHAHVDQVMEGEIGRRLLDDMEDVGIKGLYWWENGFRNITHRSQAIKTPSDLAGQKYRLMENPVHLRTFETLGADPTPMAWGEVYTSLQVGVIDGQENPIAIIYHNRVYEVQETITLSGHFYSPSPFMMSLDVYESMPPEYQELVMKAAEEAGQYMKAEKRSTRDEQVELMKTEYGKTIVYEEDLNFEEWQQAVMPVYDWFKERYPQFEEIVNDILAVN